MSHILYLLQAWGGYSLVFYLLSFLLGLWMAYLIWYAYARHARRARLRQQALNDRALRLRRQIDELGGVSGSGSVPGATTGASGSLGLTKDSDIKSGGIGVPEAALGGAAGTSIGLLEDAAELEAPDLSGSVSGSGVDSGAVEFGVKAPTVPGSSVDFPDMDMPDAPSLPDVGGGLPEFKPPEISAPEIDLPDTSSSGFGFGAPDIKGPEADLPKIDLPEIGAPDINVPDVNLPDVEAPSIDLPKIDLPDVNLPDASLPDVDLPMVDLPDVDIPKIGLPDVDAPDVNLPKIDLPDVDVPDVNLPKVDLPDVDVPDVNLPDVGLPDVDLPDVNLPDVELPDVGVPGFKAPDVNVPGLGIKGPDLDIKGPDVDLPDVDLPGGGGFGISAPGFDAPDATLPDVDLPNVDLPDVDLPDVNLPDVDLPDVDLPDLPKVEIPDIGVDAGASGFTAPSTPQPAFGISVPEVDGPKIDLPDVDLPDVDFGGGKDIDPRIGIGAGSQSGSDYKPEISSPDLDGGPDVLKGTGAGSVESGPEAGPDGGASSGPSSGGWFPSTGGEDGPSTASGSGVVGSGSSDGAGSGTSGTSAGVSAGGSSTGGSSSGGPSAGVVGGSGSSGGVKGLGATIAAGIGALGTGAGLAAGRGGDSGSGASAGPALRKDFEGEDVSYNENLGALYGSRPGTVDDLKLIKGVGPKLEADLNAAGVYRFKQLAHWNPRNVEQFADKLGTFKDRIERDRWIEQARELAVETAAEEAESYTAPAVVDHQSALSAQFFGEDVRIDSRLGILYNRDPDLDDDLQQISGIGPGLEGKLHEHGVYRFKQIANWSDDNVSAFADELDTFKDRIERDKWILQAKRLHRGTYRANSRWGSPRPSRMEIDELARQEFGGESINIDDEMGILYQGRPDTVDDLKQITGIGKVMERRLHRLGIYRFKQIANWSESQVQAVSRSLGTNADYVYHDEWIREATRLSGGPSPAPAPASGGSVFSGGIPFAGGGAARDQFAGEDVRVDPRLGILYENPPSIVDDLCQIKGVGPVLQDRLNQFGVYRFKQIANWTPAHVEAFADSLETFKDRITRDEWIAQAKDLAK